MARNRYASSSVNSGAGSKLTVMARLGYLLSKRVICSPKGFPPVFLPHTVTVAVARSVSVGFITDFISDIIIADIIFSVAYFCPLCESHYFFRRERSETAQASKEQSPATVV